MNIKYLFFIRNIRLVKFCRLWKQDLLSNGHCKILMWYTEAYIKNSFVKLKKKDIYLREFKVKKGLNILHRPGIRTHCLLFRSVHLAKTVFSVQNKLSAISSLSKKKKLRRRRRKYLIWSNNNRKWYGHHFKIIIELKKFNISSLRWTKILPCKDKFKRIFKKIDQAKALYLSYVFTQSFTLLLFLLERWEWKTNTSLLDHLTWSFWWFFTPKVKSGVHLVRCPRNSSKCQWLG
jgi:hypothetical protein